MTTRVLNYDENILMNGGVVTTPEISSSDGDDDGALFANAQEVNLMPQIGFQ
jgi:hypothetical protein